MEEVNKSHDYRSYDFGVIILYILVLLIAFKLWVNINIPFLKILCFWELMIMTKTNINNQKKRFKKTL